MGNQEGLPALDDAVIPDAVIEEESAVYQAAQGEVYDALRERGLPVDREGINRQMGPFPEVNLQELHQRNSSEEYSRTYDSLLAWQAHLLYLVAEAENNRLAYEEALDNTRTLVKKGLLALYRSQHLKSQVEVEARTDSHPEVRRLRPEVLKARQTEKMLKAYLSRISTLLQAVSRHITLRGQDGYLTPNATQRTEHDHGSGGGASRSRSPHRWPGA